MRTQEDDTTVLLELVEVLQEDPTVLVWTSIVGVIGASAFLAATVYAISRAGRFQPPRVVLSVVLGLVALVAILGAILARDQTSLAAVAATAVGGLAAALGTAFDARSGDDDAVTQVAEPDAEDDPDGPNP
jgi:predicted membrane channel-forming protein YqfA (hemolysin III family)